MMRSLCQVHQQLKETERRNIEKIYNISSSHIYNFITFNYTSTLDRCFTILKDESENKGKLGKCMHIHGRILEGMIIGINDPSQIKNTYFASNSEIIQALIKSNQIENMGSDSKSELRRLINGSMVIYIFGMSIGDTDKIWWEIIGEWLKRDSNHRLVILTYIPNYNDRLPIYRTTVLREYRNHFIAQAGIAKDEAAKIEKQIIIGINVNIFSEKLKVQEVTAVITGSELNAGENALSA